MIKPRTKTKTKTKTKTTKHRDYKKEYRDFHGKPEQIKRRDQRNKARRMMEKEGRVRKGDGKEVDHKVPLSKGGSNSKRNLRIVSRTTNRKKGEQAIRNGGGVIGRRPSPSATPLFYTPHSPRFRKSSKRLW